MHVCRLGPSLAVLFDRDGFCRTSAAVSSQSCIMLSAQCSLLPDVCIHVPLPQLIIGFSCRLGEGELALRVRMAYGMFDTRGRYSQSPMGPEPILLSHTSTEGTAPNHSGRHQLPC